MQERLAFLISAPRSGSTLLARILGAHSRVHAPEELHLLTPLAHLGFYEAVERAPYDPLISRRAAREWVAALPGGEADYLDSLRAYSDAVYGRLLEAAGRELLLDKTPAYALSLDFLARLYPRARYVVLTRNPMAIWTSQVESFFDGDPEAAERQSPLLPRYVPAVARFLRERPVPIHTLRYEELVADPEDRIRELCAFLGLIYEPEMLDYGKSGSAEAARGLGDPVTVARESRPTRDSLARWVDDLAAAPAKLAAARRALARVPDPDLEAWGFARSALEAQLAAVPSAGAARRRPLTRYALERKLLVTLRRRVQRDGLLRRLLRGLRELCDVLLR